MRNDMTRIGVIIRNAREEKKLTQAALAELVDVSLRTIAGLENDKRKPTYEVLYKLIRALDIPPDLFFFPDKATFGIEISQFIQEYLACDERERKIVLEISRNLIRALHNDVSEKQS